MNSTKRHYSQRSIKKAAKIIGLAAQQPEPVKQAVQQAVTQALAHVIYDDVFSMTST